MNLLWTKNAWEDYIYWQENNKKNAKKINNFIAEIKRSPFEGIAKPEPLKFEFAGKWSRRIDSEHRLIYEIFLNESKEKSKVFEKANCNRSPRPFVKEVVPEFSFPASVFCELGH